MANPVATGVGREHIELVWPWWWPLIKPAYERSDEKPEPTEILRQIKTNRLQCWAVFDNNTPCAGILTKLLRDATSGSVHCHIWLVSGRRMLDWTDDFLSKLIPWAKSEGCCAITTSSKRGWGRRPERFGFERIEDRNGYPTWRKPI